MFEDMVFNQATAPSEADVMAVKTAARSIAADLDPDGVSPAEEPRAWAALRLRP